MRHCKDCFLIFGILLQHSTAWGPILEPVKGGGGGFATMSLMFLKSRKKDFEEDKPVSQPFSLDYRESRRNGDGDIIPRLFIYRPLLVDFDVFGVLNPFETEEGFIENDDEDCVIPEEYKKLDAEDAAYVLDFLGIQRAKPLRSTLHRRVEH